MKKIILGVVLVLIVLGVWSWKGNDKKAGVTAAPVKIGAALTLTGAFASFGEEFRRGADIAIDEINGNGKKVEVVFEDTALDPKKTLDAVTKLVNADKVAAVFTTTYPEAAAAHTVTDKSGIPMLVLWDSNPELENMSDKVFAIGPWTPSSGEVTAEFLVKSKGIKKVAVLGVKTEWGVSVVDALTSKVKALGGTIVANEFLNTNAIDYRTPATKIIDSKPDAVYVVAEDMLRAIKQLRELGYKGVIISSDLLDNEQVAKSPSLFEGVYQSQVADPEGTRVAHYTELYKKKFNEEPKKLLYGAWGYDAVQILYKSYANSSTGNITAELYKINYSGASADIKFNDKGTSKTIPKMFVVKGGAIVPVE